MAEVLATAGFTSMAWAFVVLHLMTPEQAKRKEDERD